MSESAVLDAPATARATPPARAFPDRFNPVLVKELRASLRGRYLRILFPLVLMAATVLAVGVMIDVADDVGNAPGRDLFQACYVSMCVALLGIVPLSAFLSMGNEWDEHTYDLLVISNLRPRHIVLGKLLAVGVEAALYTSAFAPFLVFSYLLRGVDLLTIGVALASALVASLSLTAIALGFSSLSRLRLVRALLMAALGALCVFAVSMAFGFSNVVTRHGLDFTSADEWYALALSLAGILAPGVLAVALAATMLAHEEENASSAPRAAVTFLLLLGSALTVATQTEIREHELPLVYGIGAVVFVGLCDLFFVTERETLGLHVKSTVPVSRARAWLALPWLPGGGRGWALLLIHLALVLAVTHVLLALVPPGSRRSGVDPRLSTLVLAAYFVLYLGIPSFLGRNAAARARGRALSRVAIPVVVLLSMFLPALAGFLFGSRALMEMEHPLNAFWIAMTRREVDAARAAVLVLALVVCGVNLIRTGRAADELLTASRARRERERGAGAARGS